jgi:hypothetical protein
VFSRLTSFVLGKGRDDSPASGTVGTSAADEASEPEYEMDPRETRPLPTVDLRALDSEIQTRFERIRRSQTKR